MSDLLRLVFFCAVIALVPQWRVQAAQDLQPDVLVKRAGDEILALAANDERVASGQIDELVKIVEQKIATYFDFNTMTRLAVGKYWRMADESQRQSLVAEFRQLLIRTYTRAYASNREVRATVMPSRLEAGAVEATVKTQLSLPGSRPPITVDYDMRLYSGGWKIYNVTVDGVSLVTTYRADFAERIRRTGIDGLIVSLAERNRTRPE